VRRQFGHSTPKYQLPTAGVMDASLTKPCQDIGRPPPRAATLTIDSKASTFFFPCVDIVEFLVLGGFPQFGAGRCPLNPQHSPIASPPRDHAAVPNDAHQELAETIVQFPDVSEDAHGRMVMTAGVGVHAVLGERPYWIRARQQSWQR
jgi:hypothetical protein